MRIFLTGVSLSLDNFATSFRPFKASARLLECSHGGIQEGVVSSLEDHVQVMAMTGWLHKPFFKNFTNHFSKISGNCLMVARSSILVTTLILICLLFSLFEESQTEIGRFESTLTLIEDNLVVGF